MRFRRAGELKHVFDDPFQAVDFLADHDRVVVRRRSGFERFLLGEKPGLDGGERITDFMRHAGGEHAQRRQFLLALNDRVAFDQLHAQRHDHFPIDHDRERRHEDEQKKESAEDELAQNRERPLRIGEEPGQ